MINANPLECPPGLTRDEIDVAQAECLTEIRKAIADNPGKSQQQILEFAASYAFHRGGELASERGAEILDWWIARAKRAEAGKAGA